MDISYGNEPLIFKYHIHKVYQSLDFDKLINIAQLKESTIESQSSLNPLRLAKRKPMSHHDSEINTVLSDNKYLYNGKELQDEQLGGVNLDWYDYGSCFIIK